MSTRAGLGGREVVLNVMEHVLNDLHGIRDVPDGERALRAMVHGGREQRVA